MAQGDGAQRFQMSDTNPNDAIGGAGCLCSESRCEDRGGPYAVFNVTETDSNLSPHVVICAPCAVGVVESLGSEYIKAGEPCPVMPDETPVPTNVPAHENPSAEGDYPVLNDDLDDDIAI